MRPLALAVAAVALCGGAAEAQAAPKALNAIRAGIQYCSLRGEGKTHAEATDQAIRDNLRPVPFEMDFYMSDGTRIGETVIAFRYVIRTSCPQFSR